MEEDTFREPNSRILTILEKGEREREQTALARLMALHNLFMGRGGLVV